MPTTASELAHGHPGVLETASICGDRRGNEREQYRLPSSEEADIGCVRTVDPCPGPDRGTSGSMGEHCLSPSTLDMPTHAGLTSSLGEHIASGRPDERAAELNAASSLGGILADGSETDTVRSVGTPPRYEESQTGRDSAGILFAEGRRANAGGSEEFDGDSWSEVTLSILPPPYAEH